MRTLGVVGCGLIGSSFALAARRAGCFERVIGIDTNEQNLKTAQELGIIDSTSGLSDCDAVCVAVPTSTTPTVVLDIGHVLSNAATIFDVGSVKTSLIESQQQLPSNFVPAHPLAGSHLSGPQSASDSLFEGKICVITPLINSSNDHVARVRKWWEAVGSSTKTMTAEDHDRAVALTSHLPHFLSRVATHLVSQESMDVQELIGSGFRDFSRISAGDPLVWRDIFKDNQVNLKDWMNSFHKESDELLSLISSDPSNLEYCLAKVAQFRRSLDPV